jgi:hypothetical protein
LRAIAMCSSVALGPGASTVMPRPTRHGVLGIARTTIASGTQRVSCSTRVPAAMLMSTLPRNAARIASLSSSSRIRCGLRATSTMSASVQAVALSVVTSTPCAVAMRGAASGRRTVAIRRSVVNSPARSRPPRIASPIVPHPTIANLGSLMAGE